MKRKTIAVFALVLVLSIFFPFCVSASNGITDIAELDSLTDGDGQYIKYRDNYHLDIKKLGFTEGIQESINSRETIRINQNKIILR